MSSGSNTDNLLSELTAFHREVVLPDLERIVEGKVDAKIEPLREEMLRKFDAVFERLDRLESEYQGISAALWRLEERMTAVAQAIDKLALRSELAELKDRVQSLEQRIAISNRNSDRRRYCRRIHLSLTTS